MNRQTSIQLTPETERQVEELQKQGFGTFTDIVRIAIDRLSRVDENPYLHFGQGIQAFTSTGGKARLVNILDGVGGGASDLTQEQFDAYKRAKLIADPRNGGDWANARQVLEDAGFEVFWD